MTNNLNTTEKYTLDKKFSITMMMYKILMFFLLIGSIVGFIFIGYEVFLLGICFLGLIAFYYIRLYKNYNDVENLYYIKAKCVSKKTSGYRLQFKTATFKILGDEYGEDNNTFEITYSNKYKYKKDSVYLFCIHLDEDMLISSTSLKNIIVSSDIKYMVKEK